MTEITRRTALGLLGAVAVPSAATVAASRPDTPSPQQRIDAAVEEIKAALVEMHPDWRLQAQERVQHSQHVRSSQPGTFFEGAAYRHTIIISTGREQYGPQEVRWFTVDVPEESRT